jgi:uncharacterized repeat protein (TIGR01451 family)
MAPRLIGKRHRSTSTVVVQKKQRRCHGLRPSLEMLEPRETPVVASFAPGAYIVDMGQLTQTVGNALKPYGLVYDLVTNFKVPVDWAINPAKTTYAFNSPASSVDFTATITTGVKSYSGGSFIIDPGFLSPAVIADINSWKAQGVVVDTLAAPLTTNIYGQITSFPRAVLDSANGNLAVPYYVNAGVPSSSYIIGNPTNLTTCQDVYILPHADPENWPVLWQQDLYNFIVNDGGGLWAGCHAVGELENILINGTTPMNFLSNGLLLPGQHSGGSPPYTYNSVAANTGIMQIMNNLDAATQNGSEQIYVPTASWRSSTTVAVYDPTQANNPPGGTPFNDAAVVAFGNAFGNSSAGLVMYEAGHSLAGNGVANIAAQRAFFNYLLTEGINRAPQASITVPTIMAGQPATLTAVITGGDGNYNYQWVSTNGGVFSAPAGTATAGSTITTQYLLTKPTDTIRLVVTDNPCGRQGIASVNVAIPPPVIDLDADNSSGATGADYQGTFSGGAVVPAADTDTSVTDMGSSTISSATIKLTTRPDGTAETLLINQSLAASDGISVTSDGNGGFILTGTATLAQYQAVIASLQYTDSLAFPNTQQRVITVTVNDGISNSNTATSRLNFAGGTVTTVPKELYLGDPGQGMDRVDPVANNETNTMSVAVNPVVSPNSTGMALWTNQGTQNLVYDPWQLTQFGTPAVQTTDGANYITMTSAASTQRNEAIVVGVTQDQHVSGAIWNGSTWTPIAINVAGTVTQNLGHPSQKQFMGAAVAYETTSGRAMLVWDVGNPGGGFSGTQNTLYYSLWNGTSWTTAATIPAYISAGGTEPFQIRLASNPLAGSNEITMVVEDKNHVSRALVWNGSSWGNLIQLNSNGGLQFTDVNVAYEQKDGRALVTYAADTNNPGNVGYRIWNGSTWTAAATLAPPAGTNAWAQWTVLASDPNSNRIVLGVETNGKSAWMDVWSGAAWGTPFLGTAGGVANNNDENIAVAFDNKSGNALVVYQNKTSTTQLEYRTFSAGSWSGPTDFYTGFTGDTNQPTQAITLTSNPYSDQVMLLVNDNKQFLGADLWSGTSFATPIQLQPYTGSTSGTGTTQGQPMSFFWDSYLPGTVTTTVTFTQTTPMTSPFQLPVGGAVTVTTYIQLTSGTLPAAPNLAVSLSQSGTTFDTIAAPPTVTSLGGGFYKLVWTGTMPNNITVPTGGQISLTYTDYDSSYSFNILYDSKTDPSQVQLATSTYITVTSAGVYAQPYAVNPTGSPITTTPAGQPAYVRFTVTDPFGKSDITSADVVIKNSSGATVLSTTLTDANVVASTAGSKTYQLAFTPPLADTYSITVTAHEGTEGVTATGQTSVTATAAPDLVVSKSDGGATVNAGGTVAYTINYSNAGLANSTGVVLTEFLPTGSTFNAAASTPGWTALGTGAFTFTVGSLPAGASGSVVFAVTVPTPVPAGLEQLTNSVSIADDGTHGADTNPANNSASDTTPINAAPDLVVTKTDNKVTTLPGGILLYQITYSNIGTQNDDTVVLTENLPANTTFNSTYSDPAWDSEAPGQFTLSVGNLAVGASGTVVFAVNVNNPLPVGTTQISNTVSIGDSGDSGPDLNPANNTFTDTTPIQSNPQADLQITKTDSAGGSSISGQAGTVAPGASLIYTITVTNAGPNAVTGASFSDNVPTSLSGVSYTTTVSGGATITPGSGSGNNISGSLNVPVGGTVIYTVTGTLDPNAAPGTLTNIATVVPPAGVTDPNTGNNTAIDEDTIVPVSDLAVNKTFTYTDLDHSGTLTPGDQIIFAVTVTNNGPNTAQNVSVEDLLPTGYQYVSDDARANGGTYSQGTGLWTIGTIGATAPNNTAVLHITAIVGPGGNYSNTASIASSSSTDRNSANNTFTVTPPVQPKSDLSLTKTMALTTDVNHDGVISIGDQVTFTITLNNTGPDAATGVHVADPLPAGYAFVSYTASPGTTYTSGDWNVGTVNVLSTETLSIIATVVGNKPDSAYTNTAQVSASGSFDPNSSNNSASVAPFIADLSLAKAAAMAPGGDLDNSGTLTVGDLVVFTVSVSNAGPDFATGVQAVDQLPSGFAYVSDDSSGAYNPLSGLWNVGNLAPGTTATLNITVSVNASGSYTNFAQVTASQQFDPNSTPNNNVTNVPSEDDEAAVTLTPNKTLPTLTTTPSPATVTLGTSSVVLKDSATLAGGSAPTGSITFTLFYNGGTTPVDTETVPVTGNGTYTTPTGFTLPTSSAATGSYLWVASYSGNASNSAVSDSNPANEQVTVSSASPTITTSPNPVTLTLGPGIEPPLTDTATLAGGYHPTGTITFTLFYNGGITPVDTETVAVNGNGVYTTPTGYNLPLLGNVTGTYQWDATYNGDSNNKSASDINALNELVTVSTARPSLTTTPSSTTVTLGPGPSPILKDTAHLGNGFNPNGTITFQLFYNGSPTAVDTETVITSGGNGDYTTPTGYQLPDTGAVTGTYQWVASYSDRFGNNGPVTDANDPAERVTVVAATPTITTTANPSTATLGQTLQDSANLGGYAPTGSITFNLYAPGVNPAVGPATYTETVTGVNGNGTYNTSVGFVSNASGTWHWVATYNGDANNAVESSATLSEPVTVTLVADLSVTKTDGSTTYTPGGTTTYTIVVTNNGPSFITGATVTDNLPTAITSDTWSASYSAGSSGPVNGSGNINASVNLAVGGTATFTVVASISSTATGNLVNTASAAVPAGATDPNPNNNSATDTDTPAPVADLSVTKTDGSATYTPGGRTTYTIVVTNHGPSFVTGATVSDALPLGITSATWTAVYTGTGSTGPASGSGNINTSVNLASGGTATFTVVASISSSATGNLVNTATAADPPGTTDPNVNNNSATDTDTPAPIADLSVTKTDNSATYTPGGTTTYIIVVTNNGPSDVIGGTLVDNFPAAITSDTWVATVTGNGSAILGSGTGNINVTGNLAAGGSVTFTVVATIDPNATGNLVNTATVTPPAGTTDPNPNNNSATDTDTPAPVADLSITKTDGTGGYTPGTSTTYTIVVTNNGPSAVSGATVTDNFPAAITSATWTASYSAGSSGPANGSGNINASTNLAAGGTATFTVVALIAPGATGDLVNTASVAPPAGTTDPNPGNNSATDTDSNAAVADLSITKTDGSATYVPGSSTTYTIVVTNNGPSAVTGATVTDTLPTAISGASWTVSYSAGSSGPGNGMGNINASVNLAAGGTATFTVVAPISSTATGNLINTASVAPPAGTTDPNLNNNSATDTDTPAPVADLSVTKTDGSTTYTPGGTTTYTIVVTNHGPSFVTGATVSDALPLGITSATWTAVYTGTGSSGPVSGSGNINASVNLTSGGTATFTVVASISSSATGNLVNTATAADPAGTTDPNLSDNSATDTDTPAPIADLSITKTDNSATYTPGGTTTYIIVVTNNGPSDVFGGTLVDNFPAAITSDTWVATVTGSGSDVLGTGTGNINVTGNLAAGGSVTFTVVATIDPNATGNLVNTATVSPPPGTIDSNPNNSATDIDTPAPVADLSVTKTDGSTTYTPGGTTTYTIVVTNHGPSAVTGATVTDTLPAAITGATWRAVYAGTGSSGPVSGSGNINASVNLAAGGTATFTIVAAIDPNATGNLVNTATAADPAGTTDPNPSDNSATDTDTPAPIADLSVTKTDGSTTYTPGGTTTYTVVVTNNGPSAVTGASVTDTLPAAITSATWTAVYAGTGSTGPASGSGNINASVDLAAGGTATFTVVASIASTATGNLVNTASAAAPPGTTDPNPNNNSATDTDTPAPVADLSVTKTDNSATYTPGGSTTYTIVVTNNGPSFVTGTTVSDALPLGISSATWTAIYTGTGSTGPASGSGSINTSVNLAAGGTSTFTVVASISSSATGNLVNTATAADPPGTTDPNVNNNSATDTDTPAPIADLSVTKTDNSATYTPGGTTTYIIVVTNNGPSDVIGGTLVDIFPAAITSDTWVATVTGNGSAILGSGTGNINVTGNLAAGGSVTFTVVATIDPNATGNLVNTATVTPPAGTTDPNPNNNSATDTDTPAPVADLSITKTDNSGGYTPGTSTTYTIVVTNNGPSAVTGATVTDNFPAAITSATWTASYSAGSSGPASGSGNINASTNLTAGGTATFTVVALIAPGATGDLVNTASVAPPAGTTDPNPSNNSATDTDSNAAVADLSITKTDGSATYTPGGTTTYTIVVTNNGPSTVTGASVTDTLPVAITSATWTVSYTAGSSGPANGSGNINTSVNLAAGGTATFTVVASISSTATGNLVNTANVAPPAGTTDPNLNNNSATDTDTPAPVADLSVTKTDGSTTYTPGGNTTYTIVVTNNGPSFVTGATVSDALPLGITSATWTAVYAGTGSTGPTSGSGNINASVNLASGGTATFTVVASISSSATGNLVNTATAADPPGTTDPNPNNNSATDTDTPAPVADLSVTKTDNTITYLPGGTTTYIIVVTNNGPSAVTGATVTDNLPAAITSATWTAVYAGAGSSGPASGSGSINTSVNLAAGGTATFTVVASIASTATGNLVNTASAADPAGTTDPNPSNNSATDTDTPAPVADLSVTKTDNSATYLPGGSTTYTIVVTNHGPSFVTGATVSDALPLGITSDTWAVSYTGAGSTGPASGSGNITASVNLSTGGTATFTVVAAIDPNATGNLVNTATAADPAGTTDPNLSDNSATDTDTPAPIADLSVTKTDNSATYTPGGTTTYIIVVTNNGPSAVFGGTLVDNFPAAITSDTWVATVTGNGSAILGSGTGNINVTGNLAAGGSVTFTVVATIDPNATGNLVNTATVSPPAGTTDPNPNNNSATDTDTPAPVADLSITKTDNSGGYTPGTSTTYTIVVTNNGPSTVRGATVTDTFAAAFTGVTWTASATGGATGFTANGNGNINDTVTMPVGSTITYTATGTISPTATGNLVNTATVTPPAGTTDPNLGNNSATDTDSNAAVADLSITKTDGSATYVPGGSTTYTIVVTNNGPSAVTGATVTDTLPTAISGASWTVSYSAGSSGPGNGMGNINASVNLAAGGTATFTVVAPISSTATGNLINTASVAPPAGTTDPNLNNNSATDTDTPAPVADLSVTKTDGSTTYTPGGSTTYTIVVTNHGPSFVTGATVSDALPLGITSATWTAVYTGIGSSGPGGSSGNINASVNLASGGTATFTVVAAIDPNATGNLINTATVTPPAGTTDPNLNDNSATDTDTPAPIANLSVTKTDNSTTYTPGGTTTYTIVVTNNGPSAVTGASVTDILPAAITSATWTVNYTGRGSSGPPTGSGNINTSVNLASGGTATFTVVAAINPAATGNLVNTASVTPPAGTTDPNPNNSATDTDTPAPVSDLVITKTDGSPTYTPGNMVTYTITVTNLGPSNVTSASVADTIPGILSNVTWTSVTTGAASVSSGATGSGNSLAATVNITAGTGNSVVFTVRGISSASATTNLVNTATVTAPNGTTDPNFGNNSATDRDTPAPVSDLVITKVVSNAAANVGDTVTFTVTLTNNGPSTATNVTVADALPAGLTLVSATPSQGGYAGGIWTVGMVVPSAAPTLTISALVVSPNAATNTATITHSDQPDPDLTNNQASATETPQQADLALTKTVSNATPNVGDTITFTVSLTDHGPNAATNVTVADALPAGLSLVSASPSQGTYTGGVWTVGTVSPSATLTLTLTAVVVGPNAATNTATISHSDQFDPNPGNNSASATEAPPQADLALTKTVNNATPNLGDTVTFTVALTNDGPSTATDVQVSDLLPAGLTFVSAMPSQGSYNSTTGVWFVGTVAAGAVPTLQVQALVGSLAAETNTASVSHADQFDPNPGNNSAAATVTPAQADVSLTKTASTSIIFVGEPVTFSFVIHNQGPDAATDVRVSDPFPAGLQYLSNAAPSQGSYDPTTGIWFVGTMPSGTSATLEVTALVVLPGPIVNTAMVGADQFDPDLSDEISSVTVMAQLPPDQAGKGPLLMPNQTSQSIVPTTLPPPLPGSQALIAVGADAGNLPLVEVFDRATGQMMFSFMPFPSSFRGGVRVALGDVNGDGIPDIICAAGPGGGPEVVVLDGRSGQILGSFFATAPSFTGGVTVAAGDVNGDGRADIVTGVGPGGGPQVMVFDGRTFQALTSFYATAPFFSGGVTVAVGDINGDGRADIIAGFGPGGGPQVAIFDGRTFQELSSFYALSPSFRGGLYVAAGDVNGDGRADIIVGAGAGGGPQVSVFDGRTLQMLASFFATDPSSTSGVRVASTDESGTGRYSIITAFGAGHVPDVRTLDLGGHVLDDFFAYAPTFAGGVQVAGAR